MKLFNEDDVLKIDVRKKILDEICGSENIQRKTASRRRFDIYRDQVKRWVIDALQKEFKPETVEGMKHRATSISFAKKIVNKRAQSYSAGVTREVPGDEADTKRVNAVAAMCEVNQKFKKTDRYSELDNIATLQLVPDMDPYEYAGNDSGREDVLYVRPKVIPGYGFDVIEDHKNPERALCYILSDFSLSQKGGGAGLNTGTFGERGPAIIQPTEIRPDGIDQTIADSRDDKKACAYIWWTAKYHFTTNRKGEVLNYKTGDVIQSPAMEDIANPIGLLTFYDVARDRDGYYWPDGGDDIVDSCVLLNIMFTDLNCILTAQGWGQLVVAAKKVPSVITGGPHKAITIELEPGDPTPTVDFKQANAPVDAWLKVIETYVGLVLSTCNLSPRTAIGFVDANQAQSGISKLIDDSDLTEPIEDKQAMFSFTEREFWLGYSTWHNFLYDANELSPRFFELGKFNKADVLTKFHRSKPMLSEEQKLKIIEQRKALGLNTAAELMAIDNPEIQSEQADERVKKVLEDRMKNALFFQTIAKDVTSDINTKLQEGQNGQEKT